MDAGFYPDKQSLLMVLQEERIQRINLRDNTRTELLDKVAVDIPFCIFINDEFYRTLITSPDMIEELVLGHLFTERVISDKSDILEMTLTELRADVKLASEINITALTMGKTEILTTACGTPSKLQERLIPVVNPGSVVLDPLIILEMVSEVNRRSVTFKETGGTHSALLYQDGVVAFSEDVGRHNAVDKVIGYGLLNDIDLSTSIIACSGRLAGDMVLKAAVAGVPMVCSVSAPLTSGIRIAEATGITLVGFVRGQRMNVYTGFENQ